MKSFILIAIVASSSAALAQDEVEVDLGASVPGLSLGVRVNTGQQYVPAPAPTYAPEPAYPPANRRRAQYALVDFPALVRAVKAEAFSEAKLNVIDLSEGGLTVNQLGQLVDLFSFGADQVELVARCNDRILDRQNAFKLLSHFTFDADKQKVKAILSGR